MTMFDIYNPLRNIIVRLTKEEINDVTVWFDRIAKPLLNNNETEAINVITIQNLIDLLNTKKFHRRNFHYPTYAEIMSEADKLKAGITRLLTKDQVIYMLNKWTLEINLRHELLLAFKVFDTEKRDFLELDELKIIVTQQGDIFDENETREMLRDANVRGDGNIYYEDFIESMFSLAPELNKIKTDYLYENPDEDPSMPHEVIEEKPSLAQQQLLISPVSPLLTPIAKAKNKKKKTK